MIKVREIGLRNKEIQIDVVESGLYGLLENIYGESIHLFINTNGETAGYVNIYVNKLHVKNIKNIPVSDGDEIIILSSMSGG